MSMMFLGHDARNLLLAEVRTKGKHIVIQYRKTKKKTYEKLTCEGFPQPPYKVNP